MKLVRKLLLVVMVSWLSATVNANTDNTLPVYKAGHAALQQWLLPAQPVPSELQAVQISLGQELFFDPLLSGDGSMSCATCHNPEFGWSDGEKTAIGADRQQLGRASPSIVNVAYNQVFMWDGRSPSLEHQALLPITAKQEMNLAAEELVSRIKSSPRYTEKFMRAFPDQGLSLNTIAIALASFERTVVSDSTRFDRWLKGDSSAMTEQEINGFKLFSNQEKGNCISCHQPPNFTDDGFHNIGVLNNKADIGRYQFVPIKLLKGAFKTPSLRGIAETAPYFHNGSASTLMDVMDLYQAGGYDKSNLSPSMKKSALSEKDKNDIVAFLTALSP